MVEIRVSLGSFADFAHAQGVERARMATAMRSISEGTTHPWIYYRRFDTAAREGIAAGDLAGRLAPVIEEQTGARRRHYEELAAGLASVLRRVRVASVVPTVYGEWKHAGVSVSVRPHLSVRLASGQVEAWYLHHKSVPVTGRTAAAPLHIMQQVLTARSSRHVPCLVDVRAGRVFRQQKRTNRVHLSSFLTAESEALARYWGLTATG